jgi:membrane protein
LASQPLITVGLFVRSTIRQFVSDQCLSTAGSLAYTTLLALVPLTVVGFASFSTISAFEELATQIHQFIFINFIPSSGKIVSEYVEQFIRQTENLSFVGISLLAITAVLLMRSIENGINRIWHVAARDKNARQLLSSSAIYLVVIILGPLLIGASLVLTTYLTSLSFISNATNKLALDSTFLELIPFAFTWIALYLLYKIIPNTVVPYKHALIGGFIAALLFEIAKRVFAWYVTSFSSYQLLYGALWVIPVFLLWVYISWVIILLGAVLARRLNVVETAGKM